jgi:beta-galactosidase
MELLTPTTAKVLGRYEHPVWGKYAAITENSHGKGLATYVGFMPGDELMGKLLEDAVRKAGLWGADQSLAFPIVTKSGRNRQGQTVRYYFNYSAREVSFGYAHGAGKDLLSGSAIARDSTQSLAPWGVLIVLEN